jgi:hypothetical protein
MPIDRDRSGRNVQAQFERNRLMIENSIARPTTRKK